MVTKLIEYVVGRVDAASQTSIPESPSEAFRRRMRMRRNTLDSTVSSRPGLDQSPGGMSSITTPSTAMSADVGRGEGSVGGPEQAFFATLLPGHGQRGPAGLMDDGIISTWGGAAQSQVAGDAAGHGEVEFESAEWFPTLPDTIGWDWGDFGALLRDGLTDLA
jgi:hypothetical protein